MLSIMNDPQINKGKECGRCSACCEILEVSFPDHDKAFQERCIYQNPYGGCGIYEDRPSECQTFMCSWMTMPSMPDPCRPDRLGVMFKSVMDDKHSSPFTKACVVGYTQGDMDSFYSDEAKACYRMFWGKGTAVWLHITGSKNILVNEEGKTLQRAEYKDYLPKLRPH